MNNPSGPERQQKKSETGLLIARGEKMAGVFRLIDDEMRRRASGAYVSGPGGEDGEEREGVNRADRADPDLLRVDGAARSYMRWRTIEAWPWGELRDEEPLRALQRIRERLNRDGPTIGWVSGWKFDPLQAAFLKPYCCLICRAERMESNGSVTQGAELRKLATALIER